MQAGRDLAAAAAGVPGYNPGAADLQLAALKAFMQTLADHNKLVVIAALALLYDDKKIGLQTRFHQAKAAVAGVSSHHLMRRFVTRPSSFDIFSSALGSG